MQKIRFIIGNTGHCSSNFKQANICLKISEFCHAFIDAKVKDEGYAQLAYIKSTNDCSYLL